MGDSLVGVPSEPITVPWGQPQRPEYYSQVPKAGQTSGTAVLSPMYTDASLGQYRRMAATDPLKLYNYQQALARAGYMSATNASPVYSADFQKAMAAAMTDANYNGLSLDSLLAMRALGQNNGRVGGGGGGGGGSSTSTSITKSYNITSRPTAQSLLKQVLAQELGREPTSAEVSRFVKALNKEERANPSINRSTTTSTAKGSSTTSTSTPSKVDPGAEAEEFGETVSPQERRMFQSSNYYDVIASMVGGI
jgi:hypothetical protein